MIGAQIKEKQLLTSETIVDDVDDQSGAVMTSEIKDDSTAWRMMLADDWEERRRITDWKGLPQVHDYVARLMTGRPDEAGRDWLAYSLDQHLGPLASRLGRPLSMVAFGCGPAAIEAATLRFGWPIGRIACAEFDRELLVRAQDNMREFKIEKDFIQFDFNNPTGLPDLKYDVVFFCSSLHHCAELEVFLEYMNSLLDEHSLIIGLDYFGPPRLQVEYETKAIMQEIYHTLPDHLRRDLVTGAIPPQCDLGTIAGVRSWDVTEAPRSSDLRSLLFATFPVVDRLPMGGTLLRHLLANRAGNYTSEADFAILKLLMIIERELITARRIFSDDLYFVLRRSNRI